MKRPPKQTGAERNAKLLAEQILQKIGGLTISDTSIWRCAQKWSAKIHRAEEVRAKTAVGLPQRGQIIRGHVPHARPMGVAMDASVRVAQWWIGITPDSISTAANALWGEDTANAHAWVQSKETPLYQGRARQIADDLRDLTHRRQSVATRSGLF